MVASVEFATLLYLNMKIYEKNGISFFDYNPFVHTIFLPSLLRESIGLFLSISLKIRFAASLAFAESVAPIIATLNPDNENNKLFKEIRYPRKV